MLPSFPSVAWKATASVVVLVSGGLVQHCAQDLLDPHRHLLAYRLLLLCCSIAPGGRGIATVPAGSFSENVPHGLDALLAQHLHKAGDGGLLYLFEGS